MSAGPSLSLRRSAPCLTTRNRGSTRCHLHRRVSGSLRLIRHIRRGTLSRLCLMRLRALLVALVAITAAVPAAGQTGSSIQGTISDEQNAVLPGVTLTLRNAESGVVRTTISEPNGEYRFTGLPSGVYNL